MFQAVVLGAVQGLAEFLPISSSGHLILVPWLLGWSDPGLTFDLALHVGTSVALLAYFWRDWLSLIRAALAGLTSAAARQDASWRLAWMLVLGSLPAGLVGVLFEETIERNVRQPVQIAVLLMAFGLALGAADRWSRKARSLDGVSWVDALVVGCAQAVALAPGVSRSGVTMTAGLLRGLDRPTAARFSFLLSAPITVAAAAYKLRVLVREPLSADQSLAFLVGAGVAALVGALAINLLLRYLQRQSTAVFVWYRLAAGTAVLGIAFAGR